MPIYQLVLVEQKTVANQTVEFVFEKPENFNFLPGQYGGFTLQDQITHTPIVRRFSLLSAPHERYIRITTRVQESPFKKALLTLIPNDTIKFAGPTGGFVLHDDVSIPAVFIAGGIGITPFYSMIAHERKIRSNRPLFLFYGNNSSADAAYLDDLRDAATELASFSFTPIFQIPPENWEGETGFITGSLIENYFDCSKEAIFYVCGSPAMVQAMQKILLEIGIPLERIKVEDFPGY